jgi:hypothetical protein
MPTDRFAAQQDFVPESYLALTADRRERIDDRSIRTGI